MEITIAQAEHLPPLLTLLRSAIIAMEQQDIFQWDDTYPTLGLFEAAINNQTLYVGLEHGTIRGFFSIDSEQPEAYQTISWHYQGTIAVVHRLCVDPAVQNQGYGRELMTHAATVATANGYKAIRLDAFAQSTVAQRLYLQLGYRYAGDVQFSKGVFCCYEKELT